MLRERGQNEKAERLRAGELMATLAAVRTPADSDAALMEKLNAVFATEAERVANAAVLAEMLVPMIADQLRPSAMPAASQPLVPVSVIPSPPPLAKPTPPRGGSIADFIDEMIAQETPPDRPGHGAHRQAS